MISKAFFRCWTLFIIVQLLCCYAINAQAQSSSSVSSLVDAHKLLSQAKPLYKWHRARAIKHTEAAAKLLRATPDSAQNRVTHTRIERKVLREINKDNNDNKECVTKRDSDAKLRAAQGVLQRSRPSLSGKPLNHVDAAIREISIALSNY